MRAHRYTTLAAGLAAASLVLAGCGEGSGGSATGDSGGEGGGDDQPTIAFVPKLQGIPYFEAMNTGGEQACEELGCEWLYQGPVEADAAAQADIVRSYIQQGVDVLFVAPNDPDSMAPLLQQAADAGIAVATTDTDAPDSVREVFVSQASTEGIGQTLTDELMQAMGGSGRYAIVSCGETAENLNSWIEVQREYTQSEYPDAEITDVVYAGEDQTVATQMATDLMNSDPSLTGLVGECTSSAPGVAQAVRDAGKIGQVQTVGLGTPNSMAPYLEDGSAAASVLWDVEALGELTAWAGTQLAAGEEISASPDVPGIEGVTYDAENNVLLLGDPLVLTADNVGEYDY
ncbi:autoinducer 2 ABC transporter substrate-binding protein [Modestobacter sp. VKM Ac-2984]|uniref:autoinducer 2 ABC transporter substrate-binding protein n=1 Tax=Modestobacter sp. VKM Ac-2984 TaxID=3004138 RepID=UPI0022AA1639|nr:autoinducer 2 ABC transporter substrate-binding protein [Modestobacter sp. VKM Ac-2984]MCZ2815550.1 autoinducer 2 ABC transporter substrate-binding protein [Modestobacter sp. VKM Ac-2984]